MYYTFDQNNSGGYFVENEEFGIGETIIVESDNASNALKMLNKIGENEYRFHSYCECCGERWSDWVKDEDGTEVPTIYGEPIEKATKGMFRNCAYVHYKDGSFKKFTFKEKED